MKPLRLVVVRHARTALTSRVLNGCGPGASNPPLDEFGRQQARRLTERVPEGEAGFALRCSPSARTRQTAAVWSAEAQPEPRLSEVDFGRWEGKVPSALWSAEPLLTSQWWSDPDFAPPGGSSLNNRAAMFDELVGELMDSASATGWILVGHSGTVRIAASRALGISVAATASLTVAPAAVLRMRVWPDGGASFDELTNDWESPHRPKG